MILLRSFWNMFSVSELRKKIFFTLGIIIVYRLGAYIPVIGVNVPKLVDFMQQTSVVGGLLSYFDVFAGGALKNSSIFALGISPYITASILLQILSMIVPSLEELSKEGEYGRSIINQYTRYVTLALSVVYGFSYALYLESNGIVLNPGLGFKIGYVLTLSAGALFVMWMGDQISLYGIGNGSSVLIFAGIVSAYPEHLLRLIYMVQEGNTHILKALAVIVIFVLITAAIVFLEKGDRRIPVHYARRIVGNKVYGGQTSYIPFKLNNAGIMPVIFAITVLKFPLVLSFIPFLKPYVDGFFGSPLFYIFQFMLIVLFSFFYTVIAVNPQELAENIRKSGGFIPRIRPGKQTEKYFDYVLLRVGSVGAVYLATLALLPTILTLVFNIPFEEQGTSMLIVVGVALELANQVESYLIERRYDGFLTGNRVK